MKVTRQPVSHQIIKRYVSDLRKLSLQNALGSVLKLRAVHTIICVVLPYRETGALLLLIFPERLGRVQAVILALLRIGLVRIVRVRQFVHLSVLVAEYLRFASSHGIFD